MKNQYLALSCGFLIGSIIASEYSILLQCSLFLVGIGCFISSFTIDKT